MFDFLFRKNEKEALSYVDVITKDFTKIALAELADEKAINMIANAIAKSEFVVQSKGERKKDELYWRLNIRPNDNETGTDFWKAVVQKLLREQECHICAIGKKLYMIDSCTVDDRVMISSTYKNISIVCNGKTLRLATIITSDNIMHLRMMNKKIAARHEVVKKMYGSLMDTIFNVNKAKSSLKFELSYDANMRVLKKVNPDGSEEKVTMDEYKEEIKKILDSEGTQLIQHGSGISINQIKTETSIGISDIATMAKEIFTEAALIYDIPVTTYMGTISEKSDATNEFITYAVSSIVEIISDSLNAKLVGKDDFLKGDKIWIDMGRFKHVDIIESAGNLYQLRGIGFSFDDILELIGREPLNTEFSRERVVTKNYTEEISKGKNEKK